MCELCEYTEQKIMVNTNRYDPTRTTALRNSFVAESNRKFEHLVKLIREAIVQKNVLGLGVVTYQTPNELAFANISNEAKVREFNRWLEEQIKNGILTVTDIPQAGEALHPSWANKYITDSYRRGIIRARSELRKAGYSVPDLDDAGLLFTMQIPIHVQTLGLLYARVFSDLQGITSQMEQLIIRVLIDGLTAGENARTIARRMVSVINGTGIGDLGMFDKYGRFISAKRRAEILARTEITRAFHLSNVNEMRNWGVVGVSVIAEFRTAGDTRVCPECASLHGQQFTLDEIEFMIPVHPQCRCIALPIIK